MHANEFHIDETLVHKLIQGEFPHWTGLPLYRVPSAGTDNALYRLGDEMVVRLPRIDWAVGDIDKECEWLPKIATFLPTAIPKPIAKGNPTQDYPWTWGIYSWLEGTNPKVGHLSDSATLTKDLINFIKALWKVDLPNGPISNRGVLLKKRQDLEVRKALKQLKGMIDIGATTDIWEEILKVPEWSKPPVWVHGDLAPGNLLLKNDRLHAVIDFGNLGIGDPACDLIIAWNLLPASERPMFRAGLDVDDATWQRGRGWALSCALIALPYYKETNQVLASSARHIIREILYEEEKLPKMHFAPAEPSQKELIYQWLSQKHIRKWIHGVGLQNTLNGLDAFFGGNSDTTYWIGYNVDTPFAFLITSPEGTDAITLDLFICDINYIGKGFAVPMIRQFLGDHFSHMKRVLIDPEKTNSRAIHVYKKAGFKITGEFIASWHPVPHYQMELVQFDK